MDENRMKAATHGHECGRACGLRMNSIHLISIYYLISHECFCVYARTAGLSCCGNCIEIMVWHAGWWWCRCRGRLFLVYDYSLHDTIYIYWMLDGRFVRADTHSFIQGWRKKETRMQHKSSNFYNIVIFGLWLWLGARRGHTRTSFRT